MEVIEVIEGALMIAEIILTEDTNNILATISDSKNLTDNCQF
jgi:ribonuclease HII